MLSEVLNTLPEGTSLPKTCGVSACGLVSNNHIDNLVNLHILDFDLKGLLENDFPFLKVYIANDANCAAFSEATLGSAKNYSTSFFMTVSTGIGGCLVYNQELIDLPFEIGHMTISYKGKFHEVERLLSGNGIVNLCSINGLKISNAGEFFKKVKDKDNEVLKVYDEWIKQLGLLIANLQMMFATDCFVLSGGVMKSADIFTADLKEIVNAFLAPYSIKKINFVQAEFGQDAGLMGGASIALASKD